MRKTAAILITNIFLLAFASVAVSAQEKFDIVTYQTPSGWQTENKKDAMQFLIEDASKENYCAMLLFRSLPAGNDSKLNFKDAWEYLVKKRFAKVDAPETQPSANENGWTIESGIAKIENNNHPGFAMLISATGGGKLVNLLIISNSTAFQSRVESFINSIVLPKVDAKKPTQTVQPNTSSANARKSKFKFNTTNFDNGWTAIEETDWVRVTKGNIAVLLHYPHPKERETFDNLEREARTFWDLLIAQRYSNLTNFEVLRSDRDFEPARYAAGNVTDNASGKKFFVALFSKHGRGWVEVIAPDKAAFAKEFGAININDEIINWKPLLALFDYNKFAVDAADLSGKWTTTFAGTSQYASIYTGRYIGAVTSVAATSYNFGAGNSYNYRTDGATSSLGRTDFSKAESSGKFSLPTNWEIRFSDIEGRPQTFSVHFSCIRGARVLWINGNAFGRVQ